ncbi:uncharacterized protein LOC120517785 [Polypterus senegalus]|uniref:uncharacterized protein LOC120517785 n=1 Tax=Polypterus senegalus TaxID=55291 RepID=UPI0019632489|nr:uncharacterized protein LOC120517785 [Polypterus senegalus]
MESLLLVRVLLFQLLMGPSASYDKKWIGYPHIFLTEGETANITCSTEGFADVRSVRLRRSVVRRTDVIDLQRSGIFHALPEYKQRLDFHWSVTEVNILIKNVTMNDSDIYSCQLQKEAFDHSESEMLVIVLCKAVDVMPNSVSEHNAVDQRDVLIVLFVAFIICIVSCGLAFVLKKVYLTLKGKPKTSYSVYEEMSVVKNIQVHS